MVKYRRFSQRQTQVDREMDTQEEVMPESTQETNKAIANYYKNVQQHGGEGYVSPTGAEKLRERLQSVGKTTAKGVAKVSGVAYESGKKFVGGLGKAAKNIADTYYESEKYLAEKEAKRAQSIATREEAREKAYLRQMEAERVRQQRDTLREKRKSMYDNALMPVGKGNIPIRQGFHPSLLGGAPKVKQTFHPAVTSGSNLSNLRGVRTPFPSALFGSKTAPNPKTIVRYVKVKPKRRR